MEPGVTYQFSRGDLEYPAPFNSSRGSLQGAGVVGRLGMHIKEFIFFGVDGRLGLPKLKDERNGMKSTAEELNWGPVVGAQMPILGLRAWGSYVLGGHLDPEESNNVDIRFDDPKGWRVGLGLRVFMISVNLEYQRLRYDTFTLEKLGPFTTNATTKNIRYVNRGLIGSVTFPLEL